MRSKLAAFAALLAAALVVFVALPANSREEGTPGGLFIGVQGNKLVDGNGDPIRLLGVNRSGTEYKCSEEQGFFEGPSEAASIEAMKSWHVNVVRVPLNESCWLGLGGIPAQYSGNAYREAIRGWVGRLESAGLYVILDLQWAAPGNNRAGGIIPMPDADHAPEFWRSVATEYKEDRAVLFDLYNEPRPGVGWACWERGCEVEDEYFGRYKVVGFDQLVEAVRSTGAEQPLLIGGRNWSSEMRGWLKHVPNDPDHAIVAANHTYFKFTDCKAACKKAIVQIHKTYPVITGEFGQSNCRDGYSLAYMKWADKQQISYLGWAWDAGGEWTCEGGPSLIKDYGGTPTAYGKGLKSHLAKLWRERQK